MINACATLGKNAGKPDCDVRMKRPKWFLPTRGKVFTKEQLADSASLKAALLAAMLLPRTDNNKVFVFPELRVVDDNTADPNIQTLADGYEEVLNESLPSYNLQTTAGVCQSQAMVGFNGWTDEGFVVDVDNHFWYVEADDEGGKGFSIASLYTNVPRFGNSGAIVTSNTRVVFATVEEFKGGLGAVKIDFDPTKLANTVDVILYEKVAATDNVLKVAGKVACAKTDIYGTYSAALANVARWSAKRADVGSNTTITSVAVDSTNNAWTITLDETLYDAYPAGTKIIINLVNPATLAAAGVKGIEGFEFVHTKPS